MYFGLEHELFEYRVIPRHNTEKETPRRSWWPDRVLANMVVLGSRSVVSCGAGVGSGEGTEASGEESGDTSWDC